MTGKLRARVKRWCAHPAPDAWTVVAWHRGTDPETGLPISTRHRFADAPSHPEAMQAAYKLLADLDDELMEAVHASRAARRERCAECGELVKPGTQHVVIGCVGECTAVPA